MESRRKIKNHLFLIFLLSLCLIFFCLYNIAGAEDWPNWRGPNHNGISNEAEWITTWPENGPKVLWKASLGAGFASMAVSNGRVYAMGNINDNDILYCFEADTGKEIWKKSYPCPLFDKSHEGGPAATPTVDGDMVYTFDKNGDVLCLKTTTGEVLWHRNLTKELGLIHPRWYFSGSPFIVDNLVILNAGTSGTALNKADGSLVWKNGQGPPGYATAVPFVINNKKCVALLTAKELVGLNVITGEQIWRLSWVTSYDENIADPIISDDTVFVSSGFNRGCARLKMKEGSITELWRNKNMSNHCSSSVLWKGYIYGFDGQVGGGGKLTCLDYKTGETRWSQGGMGTGTLMIAGGNLVILSERGKLVIAPASPEGFKELASAQILTGKCWTVPVLSNGRIYARNAAGDLVCIDVRPKAFAVLRE